jgi:glycosyltransferase involved in cell wall biosynthesis
MRRDLVSTVIPVFNRAAMLREAVASVLAQTWRPIEIIIVNDGSSDDTPGAAHGLAAAHPDIVRVLSQPNAGPGIARQTGLDAARGGFIQFLDSDDRLLPQKFSLQVAGLLADVQAGISYGKTYTREHGVRGPVPAQRTGERHRTIFPALLAGRLWETSTPLYRRSALDLIGPWPSKRQMEDWEFDAQAGAAGIDLHYCDEWIAEYRIHGHARLAHAWMTDVQAMHDRLSAHREILRHAMAAKVSPGTQELQSYARTLFWIGRSAGVRGFGAEAATLLKLAQDIDGNLVRSLEVRTYRCLARCLGWKVMGLLDR